MKNKFRISQLALTFNPRGIHARTRHRELVGRLKEQNMHERMQKAFRSPYLYVGLGLVIGLLVTTQLKTESARPLSPVQSYDRFIDLQKEYLDTREQLKQESVKVRAEISAKEDQGGGKNGVSSAILSEIAQQQLMAGETKVTGQGVVVSLSDGDSQIKDEITKSLVHAADLRDIVNLLWYSGAEAISINGERITHNTSIDCIVSTILINTNNYAPPFTVRAIGNSGDLYGVLNGSRKLVDIKKRASKKQITFSMEKNGDITVDTLNGL